MRAMLRFGLIGAGNIARTHAAAIRASDRATLTAVAGGGSAAALAAGAGARHHADVAALIADPSVDAVVLCTPSGVRRDYAVAAAEHGKHVLAEKPIEVDRERALAMIEACERHGVTLGVVFQSRFKPHPEAARAAVVAGALGDPVLGSLAVKWHRPPSYYASAAWRGTWAVDGGGALINQAIHSVDQLLWFMGDVVRVHARAARRRHHDIEVEDTVVAHLEFASGALGVLEATTAAFPGSARRVELHGTAGTVTLVDDEVAEWGLPGGPERPSVGVSAATAFAAATHVMDDFRWHQRQIEDFVDAIEQGRPPRVDGREGLRSLDLVLAVYASARTGQSVTVPTPGV
jgi:UDP-N-acetyl-2-amino-2-deoxyglucuronate dehydrogenase